MFRKAGGVPTTGRTDWQAPRYTSMTAYKAFSNASYLGYEAIYICGFDNSYVKYLEVDEANQVS